MLWVTIGHWGVLGPPTVNRRKGRRSGRVRLARTKPAHPSDSASKRVPCKDQRD